MSTSIINALKSANTAIAKLPATPVFDGVKLAETLKSAGIDESAISPMVEFAAKKHNETHGNADKTALIAVLTALSAGYTGGMREIASLTRNLASEEESKGKVTFTPSEINAAASNKPIEGAKEVNATLRKVCLEADKLRSAAVPMPWSQIHEKLNIAPSCSNYLYNAFREGFFVSEKELKAKNEGKK